MATKTNEEIIIEKISKKLNTLGGDNFSFNVVWNNYYDNKTEDDSIEFTGDKKIVPTILTQMPSIVYGDGDMQMAVSIELFVVNKYANDVLNILRKYQNEVYGLKQYEGNVLVVEGYTTPYVAQQFLQMGIEDGVKIIMSGTVSFTNNVSDIEYIKVNDEKIKALLIHDYCTTESITVNPIGTVNKKQINKALLTTLEFKLISQKNDVCKKARDFKYGVLTPNTTLNVKIKYTDEDTERELTMVFDSVDFQSEMTGTIPVYVIVLRKA